MKKLLSSLATIASVEYQKKYIINGTKDEYLLPEDIFEEAVGSLRVVLGNEILNQKYSLEQKQKMQNLFELMKELGPKIPFNDEKVSNEDLVLRNNHWVRIRSEVILLLHELGVESDSINQYLN